MSSKCSNSNEKSNAENGTDTTSIANDSLPINVDSTVVKMDSLSPTSVGTKVDTIPKDVKYGTSTGKNEAPKHDSPNQEKIDSIKAAKKKKK